MKEAHGRWPWNQRILCQVTLFLGGMDSQMPEILKLAFEFQQNKSLSEGETKLWIVGSRGEAAESVDRV